MRCFFDDKWLLECRYMKLLNVKDHHFHTTGYELLEHLYFLAMRLVVTLDPIVSISSESVN